VLCGNIWYSEPRGKIGLYLKKAEWIPSRESAGLGHLFQYIMDDGSLSDLAHCARLLKSNETEQINRMRRPVVARKVRQNFSDHRRELEAVARESTRDRHSA
jgi:hypothetical protein